jgi:hypothetical protein
MSLNVLTKLLALSLSPVSTITYYAALPLHGHPERQTGKQDRLKERQTDRQKQDRLKERQTDRQAGQIERETDRQAGRTD